MCESGWVTWLRPFLCGLGEDDEDEGTPVTGQVPPGSAILKEIPVCGNAWMVRCGRSELSGDHLTEEGCGNWCCSESVWSLFFRLSRADTVNVALRLRIPAHSRSTLKFSLIDKYGRVLSTAEMDIPDAAGGEYQIIQVGQFYIQEPGYVQFNLEGLRRTGQVFAQVSHLLVYYHEPENEILCNSQEDAYWGRRGPSIHLGYPLPPATETEYFYNEVSIPPGSDALGLYAMAIGFSGGYFGIQVNGPEERRVLFSIWSEFDTDDPSQIPEEYKVSLLRQGPGVVINEFGNEGSGAQSFKRFRWNCGSVYKFLVHAKPLDDDSTLYEAWFQAPACDCESGEEAWQFIAAFKKPKVRTYLKDTYSFLENFEPDQGHLERTACYGNQWARTVDGNWVEIVEANFTGDATSKAGRRDFAAGLGSDGKHFYLKHCGFFSDYVPTGQKFCRFAGRQLPEVDVENLP